MKYYLAYGSNLSVGQMLRRCPNAIYVGAARIKDYRLLFRGSQSGYYLTISKKKGSMVPVLVWRISETDEENLDRYEGWPRFYKKEMMEVTVCDLLDGSPIKDVNALVYTMTGRRPKGEPSKQYLLTCLEGYRRFGFPEDILFEALDASTEG